MPCPPGYVCNELGATAPSRECLAGYFCSDETDGTVETECQKGTPVLQGVYCPTGAHHELYCPSGFYQPFQTRGYCFECQPGKFCETGLAENCPPGYYCP